MSTSVLSIYTLWYEVCLVNVLLPFINYLALFPRLDPRSAQTHSPTTLKSTPKFLSLLRFALSSQATRATTPQSNLAAMLNPCRTSTNTDELQTQL
jgi:hypothetical protein